MDGKTNGAHAPRLETTTCPECGALAEVTERAVLESTDGPVEHARVVCVDRHWFLLPTAGLMSVSAPAVPRGVDAGQVDAWGVRG